MQRTHDWAVRCLAEHRRLTRRAAGQAGAGAVRRGAGRAVRGPAPAGGAGSDDDRRRATAAGSTATASAARWRSRTWRRSSAGSPTSCPTTSRGTCSASASPTTCSPPSPPAPTRSTACRRRGWRATPRCTRRPGRFNITGARYRRDFTPIDADCDCYTCAHYTRAYLHHLFKAKEMLSATLCTIHNERFVIRLVDQIRAAIMRRRVRRAARARPRPVLLDACTIRSMTTTAESQALLLQLLDPSNRADPTRSTGSSGSAGRCSCRSRNLTVFSSFADCDEVLRHPVVGQ